MNIVMFTNTYLPHIGGVARSVQAFTMEYRRRGHRVMVVAPEFHDQPEEEEDVVRVPAIQNFNGSDFSVALPVPGLLSERLNDFAADIVHTHHPFLLGMTALRVARYRGLPLVFTHHTLYERYTHYVPANSDALQRFAVELATRYANMANHVFAPSESIAKLLHRRGVTRPITVIPTGVCLEQYAEGDGGRFRDSHGIPRQAFVVGHLGRLAPEKNLEFLATAVADFMENYRDAHFLLAGNGPLAEALEQDFAQRGLEAHFHHVGALTPEQQSDAYRAMDVFAFASHSETQGMVLTEAMACGAPVVALDASGVREVVNDGENGRLLPADADTTAFAAALRWLLEQPKTRRQALQQAALQTAQAFSMANVADRALACYQTLLERPAKHSDDQLYDQWLRVQQLIRAEWDILEGMAGAAGAAFSTS